MPFSLSADQLARVQRWKAALADPGYKGWAANVATALAEIQDFFAEKKFRDGGELQPGDLDLLFQRMKVLSADQALHKGLYEQNGLKNFNERLRCLLFGKKSLVERLQSFFELKGAGPFIASHLLTTTHPTEYPLIYEGHWQRVMLTEEQRESLYQQALVEHSVKMPEELRNRTLEVLTYLPFYRVVKEAVGLENYPLLNILFAAGAKEVTDGAGDEEHFMAVSLEKDLRDYLAKYPDKLEKGLKLFDPDHPIEYPTDVGRMDTLLIAPDGTLVVVETKKGRPSDNVVGQILRYMGWLITKGHKKVRGIIVSHEEDTNLTTALAAVPNIKAMYYAVRFELGNAPIVTKE